VVDLVWVSLFVELEVPFALAPKNALGGPDSGILLYLKTFVTNEGVLKDEYTSWDKY
jgi:hypothetical protein